MTLSRHCLRVVDPRNLATFYTKTLGMRNFGTAAAPLLGFDPGRCLMKLHAGARKPFEPAPTDFYWKTGITVRDLDYAVHHLQQEGWPVSEPRQFRDIGYLCHMRDPEGFTIEFLQQGFQGHEKPAGRGHAIGGQATLAHITLRVSDIASARTVCEQALGLRLLSIQPVPEHGFCLYFYSADDETPPHADLQSVDNREWLWARPYALLELQHVFDDRVASAVIADDQTGFMGLALHKEGATDPTYVSAAELEPFSG